MTQSGDPLENAIAERANGILKSEWLYKMTIPTRAECKVILERIIGFYNNERPHMSIGWQTPEQAHNQMGEQQRCWKNYYHTSAPPVSTLDTQQPVETEREAIAV
jgi:transposase InsO family protein